MTSTNVSFRMKLNATEYVNKMREIEKGLGRLSISQQKTALENEKDLKKNARLRKKFFRENEQALKTEIRVERTAAKLHREETKTLRVNNKLIQKKQGLLNSLGSNLASLGASVGGLYAVKTALTSAFNAANNAERATAKLDAIIKATGQSGNFNARKIDALSGSISKLSGFSKSQVKESSAMLLSFGLNDRALAKLMPRMADVAAFMGSDMDQAAQQMGKAINTGYGALTRIGITMSDTQKHAFDAASGMERVSLLAEIMDQNVGGAAKALNDSSSGFNNFRNRMNEALVPAGKWLKIGLRFVLKNLTTRINEAAFAWKRLKGVFFDTALEKNQKQVEANIAKNKDLKRSIQAISDAEKMGLSVKDAVFNARNLDGIKIKSYSQAIDILKRKMVGLSAGNNKLLKNLNGDNLGDFADGKAKGTETETKTKTLSANNKLKESSKNLTLEELDLLRMTGFVQRAQYKLELDKIKLKESNLNLSKNGFSGAQIQALRASEKLEDASLLRVAKEKDRQRKKDFIAEKKAKEKKEKELLKISNAARKADLKAEKEHKRARERLDDKLAQKSKALVEEEKKFREKQINDVASLSKNSASLLLGIGQDLATGLATSQEHAAERAAIAVLGGIGNQLVGFGAQKTFEGAGMLLSPIPDPRGAALIALGLSAAAAGVGMGATSAFLGATISGGTPNLNSNSGSGINNLGGVKQNRSANEKASPEQRTIIINAAGSVYGDVKGIVSAYSRAAETAQRFQLGDA